MCVRVMDEGPHADSVVRGGLVGREGDDIDMCE
jgi:hypothetical protein